MLLAKIATAAAASALLAGAAMAQSTTMPQNPNDTQSMDRGAMDSSNTAGTQQRGDMPMQDGAMQSGSAPMQQGTMASDPSMQQGAMPMQQGAMSADMAGANASTGSMSATGANVVTNGPVADTAENRAKYRPLSGAGRRSAAQGN